MRSFAPWIALALSVLASAQNSSSLPIVDLGYELYRASGFNETRQYYNFSNIRYAAPPTGDLRFKAPQAPATNRSVINDGSIGRICPQPPSSSSSSEAAFLLNYLATGQIATNTTSSTTSSSNSTTDPRETEDCLFLDVIVPEKVFTNPGQGDGAPVLVWIHGGGYTGGSKAAEATPSGLIDRSISNSSDGVIYVAVNYRLGALGWLSGPTFQENGTANAGLHDQRFALQWVQDNIHLFGGDKNRVTVFGESAGAGSIIHQLTAYGGRAKAPFQQAIPQSPAWLPLPSLYTQEQLFQAFLGVAGVTSLAEARQLPSAQVIAANAALIGASSSSGLFFFGPAIDGDFVTQDAKSLLNHGQFDASVHVLAAHNANESLALTAAVTTDAQVDAYVRAALPNAPSAVLTYILSTLYPAAANGTSTLYTSPFERLARILADAVIDCNAAAVAAAAAATARTASYAYLFAVYPGLHGQDVPYTYYDPGRADGTGNGFTALFPTNASVASVLQDYITSFAVDGVPRSALDGLDGGFVQYGEEKKVVRLSEEGFAVVADPAANERCKWWAMNYLS